MIGESKPFTNYHVYQMCSYYFSRCDTQVVPCLTHTAHTHMGPAPIHRCGCKPKRLPDLERISGVAVIYGF